MSLTFQPPFPIPRWRQDRSSDPDFIKALERLRRAIDGRDPEIDAARAVVLLARMGWPETVSLLRKIVMERRHPIDVRVAAAASLWHGKIPDTVGIQLAANEQEQPRLRALIVRQIGRFGGAAELELVRQAAKSGDRCLQRAAQLAEALVVYRWDLPQPTMMSVSVAAAIPEALSAPMQIEQADSKAVATALRALEREQIGLEFTADRSYRLSCARKRMLLLFPRDATGLEQITQNKGLLGVIAELDEANKDWTPGYYLLTRPTEEDGYVQIDIPRFSGRRHAFGRGRVIRGRLDFEVVGIRGRGSFPLRLSGSLDADYRLRLDTAEVGLAAQSTSVMPHSSTNYYPWP